MNLLTEKINDVVILHMKEQCLDAQNSAEFRDRMLQLRENGEINIVVNLEEVRFIDTSGLGKLLSDYKNAILQNGSLKLAGLQPQLQSIFELTLERGRGIGIYLIKSIMDPVCYRRTEQGNLLEMRKRLA